MKFSTPLHKATLLKRYKRFLADVTLADGRETTIYCPNTGSMKTCADAGMTIYLSHDTRGVRKYAYTWELSETEHGGMICINTALPNSIVGEAIRSGQIPELKGYSVVRPEVKVSEKSRIDWLLEEPDRAPCFVEVKNVTLRSGAIAEFPDAVTERGQKHLRELRTLRQQGARAVMFFLVNRTDCQSFRPAGSIDPVYAKLLREVHQQGVEVLCYQSMITPEEITITKPLPLNLEDS